MSQSIHTAPPGSGAAILGKTLPGLLYESCDRFVNRQFYNQPEAGEWSSLSLHSFRDAAEEVALGLIELGLVRGDRVGLFMRSDVHFCVADMGCLVGGLIDVPIYLTHTDEVIRYVLDHSEVKALIVSDADAVERLSTLIEGLSTIETLILAAPPRDDWRPPKLSVRTATLDEVRREGRRRHERNTHEINDIRSQIEPGDLATIIYTSGTTGRPKGVMLSHQNISSNALTAFAALSDYQPAEGGEVVLSFLPLTHIFARTLQYGFMAHGTSVYFTDPDSLSADLRTVAPTLFATVPRLLEKVHSRIQERATELTGIKRRLLLWAITVAEQYDVRNPPRGMREFRLRIADLLVYRQWRKALGGRVRYVISGGAALNVDLANLFGAAGVTVLQGYGLTESSPIIAFNRPERNRPDTVGLLLPGVEVKIAADGEILTRGPHVMMGYFKDQVRTSEAIDSDGWLHTGDIGEMTDDGYLKLTDRKNDLFKLSTGKFVQPQPLEARLTADPLVEQALVVGTGYKYCSALIFPDIDGLRSFARSRGVTEQQPVPEILANPAVIARFERIVDKANRGMDPWSTIKHFALVPERLSVESGLLTPTMKVRRSEVQKRYANLIASIYERTPDDANGGGRDGAELSEAVVV